MDRKLNSISRITHFLSYKMQEEFMKKNNFY